MGWDNQEPRTKPALSKHEALRVPGVLKAESWTFQSARRQRPDDTEIANMLMIALPAATNMLQPTVLAGRWLMPADENALVINTDLLKNEPELKVGDAIVLKLNDRETTWHIVGVVKGVLAGPFAYVNYPYMANVIRQVGRASRVQVVTAQHDAAFQAQIAKALEARFEQSGLRLSATASTETNRERVKAQFDIIVVFLMVMAILLAIVGGIGLMGTMSINVLEQTREIAVMRAIGAGDGAVIRIVLAQGLLIGVLSWGIGAILGVPLSIGLSNVVGSAFLRSPLTYRFSAGGGALWLVIVILLAALASILPARNARECARCAGIRVIGGCDEKASDRGRGAVVSQRRRLCHVSARRRCDDTDRHAPPHHGRRSAGGRGQGRTNAKRGPEPADRRGGNRDAGGRGRSCRGWASVAAARPRAGAGRGGPGHRVAGPGSGVLRTAARQRPARRAGGG